MSVIRIDRRRFLVATATLGGLTAASACSNGESTANSNDGGAEATTGGLPAGIEAIGSGYLAAHPKETETALTDGLPAGVDASADVEAQLKQAGDAVAADFKADRVERVNGWWLSETEARICALGVMRT